MRGIAETAEALFIGVSAAFLDGVYQTFGI